MRTHTHTHTHTYTHTHTHMVLLEDVAEDTEDILRDMTHVEVC